MSTALMPDPGEAHRLVRAVHGFHQQGWCPATSSNFSLRAEDPPRFWISQSGVDKASFGPEHLMLVDEAGMAVPPESRRPSAETKLHALVYRVRADVVAVLHVHSPAAVVESRIAAEAKASTLNFEGWEMQKALRGQTTHDSVLRLPVFENHQDMDVLENRIEPVLRESEVPAFVLAGHGIYGFGRSVGEAKRHVEAVETLCEHAHRYHRLKG